MKAATTLVRNTYSPGQQIEREHTGRLSINQRSLSHPGVTRDNRMLNESIRLKEQSMKRDQDLKGFLESSYNSGAYKSNRYQSPEK